MELGIQFSKSSFFWWGRELLKEGGNKFLVARNPIISVCLAIRRCARGTSFNVHYSWVGAIRRESTREEIAGVFSRDTKRRHVPQWGGGGGRRTSSVTLDLSYVYKSGREKEKRKSAKIRKEMSKSKKANPELSQKKERKGKTNVFWIGSVPHTYTQSLHNISQRQQ